ncbi:hypothetical protein ACFO0N_19455 [Halobium salinum]|uniref:ABC-2 type transport system permease protein n=1 Tax=Halobium salinum TaxID=1364940 RepID=A0ABD5PHG5_9EURY|nr:hypothetical protein [Halobium salinum]
MVRGRVRLEGVASGIGFLYALTQLSPNNVLFYVSLSMLFVSVAILPKNRPEWYQRSLIVVGGIGAGFGGLALSLGPFLDGEYVRMLPWLFIGLCGFLVPILEEDVLKLLPGGIVVSGAVSVVESSVWFAVLALVFLVLTISYRFTLRDRLTS